MSDKVQYTNSKVQPADYTSGWKVAFILAALGVSLPMLYLGSEMALTMGWENALIGFSIATVVLTALCMATTIIGNRSRLSTYMLLRFPFGKHGAKVINLLMGISLLGWFSVALELLSEALVDTLSVSFDLHVPLSIIIVLGSIFITMTTIYGIRSLEKLANVAVPILLIFLLYVVYVALNNTGQIITTSDQAVATLSLFEGTSALVGSSILVPVLMADFSRYIVNNRQSLLAVLGLTIGTPLVWVIAGILAIKTGEVDIIQMMNNYGLVIPAIVLIFVSTWVTNATNLYSVALTFATLKDGWNYSRLTLVASVFGTILALAGFSNYFIEFLNVLAIFAPSIAAIYIIDFFLIKKGQYELDMVQDWGIKALLAWVISSTFAAMAYFEIFSITSVYYLDAFLVGGLVYYFSKKWKIKK